MSGAVTAVHSRATHNVSKETRSSIRLLVGLGVEGDAHCGATVKHRSRVAKNPDQPNLRQVHLIHSELHEELADKGFVVAAGRMGENVTTLGVDLLALPRGSRLRLGDGALIELTGLRNPCSQLEGIQPGLLAATLDRDSEGFLIRKAGVMGVVLSEGTVAPGDPIEVELPSQPHHPLEPV